jgi:hypothetical protein
MQRYEFNAEKIIKVMHCVVVNSVVSKPNQNIYFKKG